MKAEEHKKTPEEQQIEAIEIRDRDSQISAWVNYRDELSVLIGHTAEFASISLNLKRCQQLRQILDLYEQYLAKSEQC